RSWQRPMKEAKPTLDAYSAMCRARRVFPTPGPPPTISTAPRPFRAAAITASMARHSFSRLTKAVRLLAEKGRNSSAIDDGSAGFDRWSDVARSDVSVSANCHLIGDIAVGR